MKVGAQNDNNISLFSWDLVVVDGWIIIPSCTPRRQLTAFLCRFYFSGHVYIPGKCFLRSLIKEEDDVPEIQFILFELEGVLEGGYCNRRTKDAERYTPTHVEVFSEHGKQDLAIPLL